MPISTRQQQLVLQALDLLNQSAGGDEDFSITKWLQNRGITPTIHEEMFAGLGKRYSLTREQVLQAAEVESPLPKWFQEMQHPLQYAVPGLYVIFLADNGRYVLTTVCEVKAGQKETPPLLAIEGLGKGWCDQDGKRTTKDGRPFQGSAYAGQLIPVDSAALERIERQQLLTEITGYHQSFFREGGAIHKASLPTLHLIQDVLTKQDSRVSESSPL